MKDLHDIGLHDIACVHVIGEYKFKPMNMKGTESLKTIRKNNTNWIVYAHLIITSLRNKSDSLTK